MKKILTLAMCFSAMLSVSSAQAAAYSYNVTTNTLANGATNFWNVLFESNDRQSWTVLVTPSGSPFGSPNADLFFIDVSILDSNGDTVQTSAIGNGGRSPGSSYTASPANLWTKNSPGGGNANWNVGTGSAFKVNRNGTQSFSGSFSTVSPTLFGAVSATVRGRDGSTNRQWDGVTAFTPEMPGGVLLLAALLPLGLALRSKAGAA
jgi:hypothetical protein